jgi:hypothetical protein
MNVPLDKLYKFLHGVTNHDNIMYHWATHGSKKASDIITIPNQGCAWQELTVSPQIICHDQEPLDFEFYIYSWDQEYEIWMNRLEQEHRKKLFMSSEIKQLLKPYGLKTIIDAMAGVTINDACILLHSEKNSSQHAIYRRHGYIPVFFWSHAIIARDWLRYAKIDPEIGTKETINKTFLIYNRAWSGTREYRLKFAELLLENNLHTECNMKFNSVDDNKSYLEHQFVNQKFAITRLDLDHHYPTNNTSSNASAEYQASDYNQALCEVVLETVFDDQRIHLTEKTLRPIACQQPFLTLSGPGTLEYLKSYGFKTFNNVIDESYDTITDSYQRMQAVVKEMQRISKLSAQDKKDFVSKTDAICKHNRDWFFSDDFFNLIIDEYKRNIDCGMQELYKFKTGNMWIDLRSRAKTHYPDLFVQSLRQNSDDINWVMDQLLERKIDPSQDSSGGVSL